MAKMTEANKSYISTNYKSMTSDQLSQDTGLSIATITSFLGKNNLSRRAAKKEEADNPKPLLAGDAFINKTSSGREGIAILTPAASELGDSFREHMKMKDVDPTIIHTIKEK